MTNTNNINISIEKKENFKKMGIRTGTKHFKRFYKAGLLNNKDVDLASEVQNYWDEYYNKNIDPVLHLAFFGLTGKKEKRLVPSKEMWNEILPYFNDMGIRVGYSDKNIYDKLIPSQNMPKTILKRVRGNYYDQKNNDLDLAGAYKQLTDSNDSTLIIKPSDTDNGKKISKLEIKEGIIKFNHSIVDMKELENFYGPNFIVQEKIEQHSVMSKPHPASVNSLRVVTLRWKSEIRYLLTFARFGTDDDVRDNAGAGGLCVGISDTGEFMDFAIDENCNVYSDHPSTGYSFADHAKVPNFSYIKQFVMDLHKNILHHDFVSWDIAVGKEGQPIFIEANFRGATWIYQLAAQKPLFGELTEDILKVVEKERKDKSVRDVNSQTKKLRQSNQKMKRELKEYKSLIKTRDNKHSNKFRNLKKQNYSLRRKLKEMQKTLDLCEKRNRSLQSSTSWRITRPLRCIGRIIKRK